MPPAPPALCVFDVCGTLYTANTTLAFLRFYHRRRRNALARLVVVALTRRWSPGRYVTHIVGLAMRRDWIRTLLVATLRGERRDALREGARAYVAEELGSQGIAHSQRLLVDHKARGERIMLMSNSIEPVIEAIADALGVEHVASTLAYDGEICLGRIARDLTGRKHLALADVLAAYPEHPVVHVATDNASDRNLLDAADERTVIWQGKRPHAAFARLEADYVCVEGK